MQKQIPFTIELVTPAYAGGADPKHADGIRPPTVKALLRFWWRALHPELPPKKLFAREAELFGSTKKGQGVRIIPRERWVQPQHTPPGEEERDRVHGYMAYGPVAWEKSRRRPELKICRTHTPCKLPLALVLSDFVTVLNSHREPKVRPLTPMEWAMNRIELEAAVWMWSAFGGIGSRSRRAAGSVKTTDFPFVVFPAPQNAPDGPPEWLASGLLLASAMQALEGIASTIRQSEDRNTAVAALAQILKKTPAKRYPSYPEHTALSKHSQFFVGPCKRDARAAWSEAYNKFYAFRRKLGWYRTQNERNGHPEGPDHKWRTALVANRNRQGTIPQRLRKAPRATRFGLPLTGHMSSHYAVDVMVEGGKADRRASPLFFKVLEWGPEQFFPVVMYLPSRFLPADGTEIKVEVVEPGSRPRSERIIADAPLCDDSYEPVKQFLSTLDGWTKVKW